MRALDLDDGCVASLSTSRAAPPAVSPAVLTAAAVIDGACLALCEQVDVAPGRLRGGLVEFLRRIEAGGVTLDATREHLAPKPARRT